MKHYGEEDKRRVVSEIMRVTTPLLDEYGLTDEKSYWEATEKGFGKEAPRFFSAGAMLGALSEAAYCYAVGWMSQFDREAMTLALSVIAKQGKRLASFASGQNILRDEPLVVVEDKAKMFAAILNLPLKDAPSEMDDMPLHAAEYVIWSAKQAGTPEQLVPLPPSQMIPAMTLAWECASHRGFALERYSSCCNLERLRQMSALQLAQERAEKLTLQESLCEEKAKTAATGEEKEKLEKELKQVQEEKRQVLAKAEEAEEKVARMDELEAENKRLQAKIDKRNAINRKNASGPRDGENPEANWKCFLPWLDGRIEDNLKKPSWVRKNKIIVIEDAITEWNKDHPNNQISLEPRGVETKHYRWKNQQPEQPTSGPDSAGGLTPSQG